MQWDGVWGAVDDWKVGLGDISCCVCPAFYMNLSKHQKFGLVLDFDATAIKRNNQERHFQVNSNEHQSSGGNVDHLFCAIDICSLH